MMFTVPHPLCCTTLSPALYAPPPMIHVCWPALSFLIVMASSQTSSNQTNWRVHGPSQCTPSAWFLPMMTFLRVAPDLSKKTASASPDFEVSIRQSRLFIWSKCCKRIKEGRSRVCAQPSAYRNSVLVVILPPSAWSLQAPLPRSYRAQPPS